MTKYRTVQVELQVPKPVRSLNQRRPMTECGIGKSDPVFCSAESDLLFQTNYLTLPSFTRGLRLPGKCSIPFLETVKSHTHVNRIGRVSYPSNGDHVHASLEVSSKVLFRYSTRPFHQNIVSKQF